MFPLRQIKITLSLLFVAALLCAVYGLVRTESMRRGMRAAVAADVARARTVDSLRILAAAQQETARRFWRGPRTAAVRQALAAQAGRAAGAIDTLTRLTLASNDARTSLSAFERMILFLGSGPPPTARDLPRERLRSLRDLQQRIRSGWADLKAPPPAEASGRRTLDSLAALAGEVEDDARRDLRTRLAGMDETAAASSRVGAVLIVLLLLAGAAITASMTRTARLLRRVRNAADQYARGQWDRRLPEEGAQELRDLIVAFNAMGEQFTELERLKADFFSKLVHDFKSPLDNIKQSADVLLGDLAAGRLEAPGDFLEIIRRSASNLRTMVQEQLEESKLLAGQTELKYEQCDLKQLMLDRIQLQKPSATARRINFAVKFTDAAFTILGDPAKLSRVVDNLLVNAIKFTAAPSTITVELDDRIDGMVEFRICDQGPGIPEPMRDRVFQKYVRLAPSGGATGTGLGLFTARYIVELHHGQIWVTSREGAGAVFHVLLPREAGTTPSR